LRFENKGGKLRNKLDKTVPERAGAAVRTLFERQNGTAGGIGRVLAHAGGKKVIEAVGLALEARFPLAESSAVLRRYGNMSSPSVLFALGEHLRTAEANGPDAQDLWLTSFGAGFSAHACRLTRPGPGA
jgi:alkylresorcinol/alkylpyrone synthase